MLQVSKALVATLTSLLGDGRVSVDERDLLSHMFDTYSRSFAVPASKPLAVVFARSTEDVQKTLAFASDNGIGVVPYGGGTGVTGGATSVRPGVVLDLRGLAQLHELDVDGRRAQVGAGMLLAELCSKAEAQRLLFAHDPWSLSIATVGGSIAVNGVGYLAGRYGAMGDQVLGLEVVLPNGRVVTMKGLPKASGPGLTPLFIGSEGTLGVITKATVHLYPQPERRVLRAFSFKSFEHGFGAAMEMYRVGLAPALMDFAEEPLEGATGTTSTLYLGFEGLAEEVAAQVERGQRICQQEGGVLLPEREAIAFWDARHEAGERYQREVLSKPPAQRLRHPRRMDYVHVAIPASRVVEYHRWCRALVGQRQLPVNEWSFWGRPEFFSFLIIDPFTGKEEQLSELFRNTVDEMLQRAQDMGGSMEYCHGVGLKLGAAMERELGPTMELLRAVKRTLDPAGIMNPGKLGL
ncbi:MAG: FAD-binding oxidoreductase [Dehalococcoidia bacterium]|nr:FAD-binding oxidoreductase [Dehalococcoidia bacterium]